MQRQRVGRASALILSLMVLAGTGRLQAQPSLTPNEDDQILSTPSASAGLPTRTIPGGSARGESPLNLPGEGVKGESPLTLTPVPATVGEPAAPLQKQIRQLQKSNQALLERIDALSRKYDRLSQDAVKTPGQLTAQQGAASGQKGSGGSGGKPTGTPGTTPQTTRRHDASGGTSAEETGSGGHGGEPAGSEEKKKSAREILEHDTDIRGPYKPDMEPIKRPSSSLFQDGLEWYSQDGYFSMIFHNLSQLDYKAFSPTGDPLHDTFNIPRQRWYFQGNVSPFANYYTVINRGYNSLDLLDSWVDFNFAPQYQDYFQLRVGRMKTPYTYEYIKISESDLIAPERSLFVGNLAGNRQEGAMAHGRLFNKTMEYMVGVFNGPRRSFDDFNSSKDIYFFTNIKPFLHSDICWLRQLNIAGSFNTGNERNPTQPQALRTASDQSPGANADAVSPTFLHFNNNVFENGWRAQWAGDVAYYYKSFTMLAGYQGGFQNYSTFNGTIPNVPGETTGLQSAALIGVQATSQTKVPLLGWSCALTYFLTGEEITRRVYLVEPIRPFGFYNGRLNPGAIEIYGRVANLQLGDQVFSGGLVTPGAWANRATTTDIGVNWYLNHYIRMYLDWQHSEFNQNFEVSPFYKTKHMEMYWLRTQIFF